MSHELEMSPQHNTRMKRQDCSVGGVSHPLGELRILVEWARITGTPGLKSLENVTYLTYRDPPTVNEYVIFQVGLLPLTSFWVTI